MIFTVTNPTLNKNLKDFWKTRQIDDYPVIGRVLWGGRMSSKSHDMAGVAIARANHNHEVFLCTRMFQNRISDSVYSLLKAKIYYFELQDRFKIYADAIENKFTGSLFRFYGISRNIEEIKSFEGATVWWNEESQNLTKEMFTIIRPTIMRNDLAEMWFTMNPRLDTDYAYERLIANPPKGFLVRKINYDENPFLVKNALDDIANEFEEDPELADHIYNGVALSDDDQSVIKRSWVDAAVDAHIKLNVDMSGNSIAGYDIADSGEDRNCVALFDGSVCKSIDAWKAKEDELRESAIRAMSGLGDNGFLIYDSIGVGAHTGSTLNSVKFYNHSKFNAGGGVFEPNKKDYSNKILNKDRFENLKAQAWFNLADRFRNTYNAVIKGKEFNASEMISISSGVKHIEALKAELCAPRKSYSNRGLDQVESKKDVKKRLEKSHDLADAFVMGASIRFVKKPSTAVRTY